MCDYNNYQISISNELISIKNRIRNFIGNNHWGEDGRYKEVILRDIISEKLPGSVSCGTGFAVGSDNRISTQIDIIVYRNDIPLLFKKSDFVIVSQEAVLGMIEVKTSLTSGNIEKTIEKAHENGALIDRKIFNGIFSYNNYNSSDSAELRLTDKIERALREHNGKVDHICFGKDNFLKYWEDGLPQGQPNNKYRLYKIYDLAFGYFISNLIEECYIAVCEQPLPQTLKNVFYPIENTKEAHTAETLIL